ncbi:DUF3160 domain-containing protein [Saccharicrinis sp. FJH54]|uniref:DUF3160 domain-containing protein n=1 Tax=Saccharicrinis sp. FJH54 TaxID=3344665 RepID=UPI0035D4B08D
MKSRFLIILLFFNILLCSSQSVIVPETKLTTTDIENKTVSELWILRNSIFAKYGRPFKTYELHAFFMKQPWYKPNQEYKQSDLSDIDRYNVNLIGLRENQLREKDYITTSDSKEVNIENIYNTFQYPSFNAYEKKKLRENGFLAIPTNRDQLFYIYENNDYLGIPSFITTDAVLQLYHLYFDMSLRTIETKYLTRRLEKLINLLITELGQLKIQTNNAEILDAIDYDLAYLGVCKYFISEGETEIQGRYKDLVMKEIENCKNHVPWKGSEFFGRNMDYSLYIPRGHYTRSKALENYFMAMMWLGNAGFSLKYKRELLGSMLITSALYNTSYEHGKLIQLWNEIYEPTVFYVGLSDDTGPVEMKLIMDNQFTENTDINSFANSEKLNQLFIDLPSEKISGHGTEAKHGKQFRLMGQRFIPDSYIFHRLTNARKRKMPNGLDIMAGFGNTTAKALMLNDFKASWEDFPVYPDTLAQIIKETNNYSKNDWTQNLYYYWLYNLKALYDIKSKDNLPFFMTTEGWKIKTLNTAMASWAELRHNTILYAKQSSAAECGSGGEELTIWIPEPPKGYVEPNTEFYNRMLSLIKFTTAGLKERDMLDYRLEYTGSELMELLIFLSTISEKENNKDKISLEEYEQIQKFGSLLDNLTLRILSEGAYEWWEVDGPDKNMPVIADVHTAADKALEVGVGRAQAIYVIVDIEGKLKLTRGAIFSYYEFEWPATDRLTDEKWQKLIENREEPDQPSWINYKSDMPQERFLTPLFKPEKMDIPESSKEPGWRIIYYETGC